MSTRLFQTVLQSHRSTTSNGPGLPTCIAVSQSTYHHTARFQAIHHSAPISKSSTPTSSIPKKPDRPAENPSFLSFSLFHEVRNARPAVRYTVYAGVGLMATVESTFWFNVIRAKFFPSSSPEDKEKAEEFLVNLRGAVAGYKATWMTNYGRYYGGYVWGVGER